MGQGTSSSKRSANDIQNFLDKEKEKFVEKIDSPLKQNAALEDFDLIRTIGTGSFGNISRRPIFFSIDAVFFQVVWS